MTKELEAFAYHGFLYYVVAFLDSACELSGRRIGSKVSQYRLQQWEITCTWRAFPCGLHYIVRVGDEEARLVQALC